MAVWVVFVSLNICEVDISFAEYAGQRLDIRKNFPGLLENAGERGRERKREKKREWSNSHPWDSPNLELRALLRGLMLPFFYSYIKTTTRPHITCIRHHCLD